MKRKQKESGVGPLKILSAKRRSQLSIGNVILRSVVLVRFLSKFAVLKSNAKTPKKSEPSFDDCQGHKNRFQKVEVFTKFKMYIKSIYIFVF